MFDVNIIQIWTFPAAPSTERVPSLAERVAYLRYSINLRLLNWRVPALQTRPSKRCKSRIDVLIFRQYLKKDFFVEKKKNREGQGGKYLQKEN